MEPYSYVVGKCACTHIRTPARSNTLFRLYEMNPPLSVFIYVQLGTRKLFLLFTLIRNVTAVIHAGNKD